MPRATAPAKNWRDANNALNRLLYSPRLWQTLTYPDTANVTPARQLSAAIGILPL